MASPTSKLLQQPQHAPLIFSVSLAVFDLHLGNSISYTYPLTAHGTPEPVVPSNIAGGAKIHDYCFPDGSHDAASDTVAFLVRLNTPLRIDREGNVRESEGASPQPSLVIEPSADMNNADGDGGAVAAASGDTKSSVRDFLEKQDADSLRTAIVGSGSSLAVDDASGSPLPRTLSQTFGGSPTGTSAAAGAEADSKPTFLDQPQSLLYGTALYVRAADSSVERGALQRAFLVLTRVPLHRSVSELLQHRVLKTLADSSYKNDDPRLRDLVEAVYKEFSETFRPCVTSFRSTTSLFTELDGGQRVFLPRVGRLHNPSSHLVLMGYRSSVVSLLRMLGPTHSALLLHAIISRMPVIVIGRTAAEVCDAVSACIHLCRPLPIDISHFAPYAPISTLDKLTAAATEESMRQKRAARMRAMNEGGAAGGSGNTSPTKAAAAAAAAAEDEGSDNNHIDGPIAVIGATNAFIAHKHFDGICKLILPSLAEEVAMSLGDVGDGADSFARRSSSRRANAAMVQYPASSMLHKKGPSAFLPRSFLSRVKGLVAIAMEGDASEVHVRSLALSLNFAFSLEIRSNYGDVGAAFASAGGTNVVSTPLISSPSSAKAGGGSSSVASAGAQQQKNFETENNKKSSPPPKEEEPDSSNKDAASPISAAAAPVAGAKPEDSSGFDMVDSFSSPTKGTADGSSPAPANLSQLNSFPALNKNRSDEAKLIQSLELAGESYAQERSNERKTVVTVHRWFSAVRSMLAEVAASSTEQQRILFDGLMSPTPSGGSVASSSSSAAARGDSNNDSNNTTASSVASPSDEAAAIARDILNLHQPNEDVGNYLTGEDILLTVGEQQRLNRLDLARFVEHYRRRAGAAIDMLCGRNNVGARSRPANELFCDTFNISGLESYEIPREVLLAQASATVVQFSPCEGPEHTDPSRPPKPFWENVESTVSLSANYLCLDAANQTITTKAMSKLATLLPKGESYYEHKQIAGFYAEQVIPIAAVARIEVIEAVGGNNSGGILANKVIQNDQHTLRLHLSVETNNEINSKSSPEVSAPSSSMWRAKLDLRLSQKSGVSQLLFLVVNKHQDFTQAIKRITPVTGSSSSSSAPPSSENLSRAAAPPTAAAAAAAASLPEGTASTASAGPAGIEPCKCHGRMKHIICPVFMGLRRIRDVPALTWDEVYENERNFPIIKWSKKLMPHDPPAFSDRCGIRPRTKESVDKALPSGWEWTSEWTLVPYYEGRVAPESFEREFAEAISQSNNNNSRSKNKDDDALWAYGTFWRLADFHASPFPICSIRRRKWVRQRRLIGAAKEGMSAAVLQRNRDAEASAAEAEVGASSSGAGAAATASASSSTASLLAAQKEQRRQESPDKDLHSSLAFVSHLSSMEQLEDKQGSGSGPSGSPLSRRLA